jgi:hypothetical protein
LSAYASQPVPAIKEGGKPQPTFASTDDPIWRQMLSIIKNGRELALKGPRIDMPGAEPIAGKNRMMVAPAVPRQAPVLEAAADESGAVNLRWQRTADTIGLCYELHRSNKKRFAPNEKTVIARTELSGIKDRTPPAGPLYYALVILDEENDKRSKPCYAKVAGK